MSNYELVAGDGGSTLHVTIRDAETTDKLDLTGKTVTVRWSLNAGATIERAMTLRNQVTNPGEADYQFTTTDVPSGGELTGEVRLQAGQSDQLTTVDLFHLSVKASLP